METPETFSAVLSRLVLDLASDEATRRRSSGQAILRHLGFSEAMMDTPAEERGKAFGQEVIDVFSRPEFPVVQAIEGLLRSVTLLGTNEPLSTCWASQFVLRGTRVSALPALPVLVRKIERWPKTWAAREIICDMLRAMGPAAGSAAPALMQAALRIGTRELNQPADTLAAIVQEAEPFVNDLVGELATAKPNRRHGAMLCLAGFGERAGRQAIPALLNATEHGDADTRSLAAMTLGRIAYKNDTVARRLLEMTRDSEWFVRGNAIEALGRVGSYQDRVIVRAIELLEDHEGADWSASDCALRALAACGPSAREAVSFIARRLTDWDDFPRDAVEALGRIGNSEALVALESLLERLRNEEHVPASNRQMVEQAIQNARAVSG